MSPSPKDAPLNPRTTSYEFLGPPGALAVTLGVPFLTYALYFGCNESTPPLALLYPSFINAIYSKDFWISLWDVQAFKLYYSWYTFCVVAWAILPGDWVKGTQLRNGHYQHYKVNAFATGLLAIGLATGYIIRFGYQSFTFFYEHWVGFLSAALSMSILQAAFSYASGSRSGSLLALGGNSGNLIYDFYIGRTLNPQIGSLDIKSFNELRPGLILWFLIDISMACEQATRIGGRITDSMALVLVFQGLYVVDALYNEPDIFRQMDITTDGFGFMLSVGDLLWVPFVYSLQARYLAFHPIELGWARTVAIIAVNAVGFWIFRSANSEKNEFRNGKNPKNLQFITTERGTKLLTSGWWGMSQHPNYLGDIIMALAWSLPTGFEAPLTYFYVVYFGVLLIHRQRRDDEACEKKYGKDWEKYKKLVPYRIVPYLY
ncbi:ERG4/ERG24 ergosterol biosynthesis protein [Auriscalpium vulgare]|uniref:ERG4/ERG24 ergosterol biosynthesis protein n=1 Tax=Auriscalpium vulgare TaxID=40419 RepID=A0ACB8S518_9AGAM|nr:ERG4/ERG24 ergosterol biosynthesis protein [Auriscalpium vulgare]